MKRRIHIEILTTDATARFTNLLHQRTIDISRRKLIDLITLKHIDIDTAMYMDTGFIAEPNTCTREAPNGHEYKETTWTVYAKQNTDAKWEPVGQWIDRDFKRYFQGTWEDWGKHSATFEVYLFEK